MTRKECLDNAAECVLQDRASQYGRPEDNFGRIAKLWSTYTGTVLDGIDVAMMMSLLKVARIRNNKGYEDGYIDLAGYAACGAELAGAEKAREDATRKWGEEYKKLREQAEGGCCQKGKDHSPEEPEFTHGDAVEWNGVGSDWLPAVYLREFGDFGHCVVRLPDGRERIVRKADLRRPEANHPENPDSSTEAKPKFKHGDRVQANIGPNGEWEDMVYYCKDFAGNHLVGVENAVSGGDILYVADAVRSAPKADEEPKFKPGDRVQYRVELPSVSDSLWRDATYLRPAFSWQQDGEHIVSSDLGPVTVKDKDIRPAPKAEGCEALVEKDAPQTAQELYKRIIANNPATYGTPHKPTGEELAEEEDRG